MKTSEIHGIDALLKKLGHDIAEIRTRALGNILSKLEHGLLNDADLIQERQLFVHLLEWFNFRPSPMQSKVFTLLERLTKNSSACDLLASIGAVSFFSLLRPDVDSDIRPQLDVVLERLFHVTDTQVTESRQRQCVYGHSKISKSANTSNTTNSDESVKYGYFNANTTNETVNSSIPPVAPAVKTITCDNNTRRKCLSFAGFPWHSLTGGDRHVLSSTGISLCSSNPNVVINGCSFLLNVVFRDFPPEIFLQRPAIVKTLITLLSSRPTNKLMIDTLECIRSLAEGLMSRVNFFEDPIMYCTRQGLPFHDSTNSSSSRQESLSSDRSSLHGSRGSRSRAEGKFERSGGDGREALSSSSTSTPNSARFELRNRYHDPRFGTGSEGGFTSNFTTEEDDFENERNIRDLQILEMVSPQFALSALLACVPPLKTESAKLSLSLLQSLVPLIHLLQKTIKTSELWKDKTMLAQNLQALCRQLMEAFGDVILYHYDLYYTEHDWMDRERSVHEMKMHRLVYEASVGLLVKLLQTILPMDEVVTEIRSSAVNALFVISCDASLQLLMPDECEIASIYLQLTNTNLHNMVIRAQQVGNSFQSIHTFNQEYQTFMKSVSMRNFSPSSYEVMETMERSLEGFCYNCDVNDIKQILASISRTFEHLRPGKRDEQTIEDMKSIGRRILLRLMSFPLSRVRRIVYDECLMIIRSAINISSAAGDPRMKSSHACRFLLDTDILYELCAHGLSDSCRLVSSPAQELLVLLLQGRLLIADDVWWDFSHSLRPVLVVLQAYTGDSDLIRSAIDTYLTPSAIRERSEEDDSENIRCSIRGLLLNNRPSRAASGKKLKSQLKSDHPEFEGMSGLTDLLIVETPLSLLPPEDKDPAHQIRRCVYKEEVVVNIINVLHEDNFTDQLSVRVGAIRQLFDVLQDMALMRAFLSRGGLELICSEFYRLVPEKATILTELTRPAFSACVAVLKLMLRRDTVVRERLSRSSKFLMTLLRAATLCRLAVAPLYEVAVVVGLLVFHDVLRVYVPPTTSEDRGGVIATAVELSLPQAVNIRYKVPFVCPTHDTVSSHRLEMESEQTDQLLSGPLALYLRQRWHLAHEDGDTEAIINKWKENERKNKDDKKTTADEDVCNKLDLTLKESDYVSILLSNPGTTSRSLLEGVCSSQSHSSASHSFCLIRVSLLVSSISTRNYQFVRALLHEEDLRRVLEKFLQVAPTCYEDESLLITLTSLLDELLASIECRIDINQLNATTSSAQPQLDPGDDFLTWIMDVCLLRSPRRVAPLSGTSSDNPLLYILESLNYQQEPTTTTYHGGRKSYDLELSPANMRRQLCERILKLFSRISRFLFRSKTIDFGMFQRFHHELRRAVLIRLRLTHAPEFYDLTSVEVALASLVHVSANRVRLKEDDDDEVNQHFNLNNLNPQEETLLKSLLVTLLEIISAFDPASGASNLSYMGKGVSRCASQCILHITRELAIFQLPDWPRYLEKDSRSLVGEKGEGRPPRLSSTHRSHDGMMTSLLLPGFEWLIPLWSARDTRTRVSSLAIAALVTRTPYGAVSLTRSFKHVPDGLWGLAMAVFLDHSECAAARSHACELLSNLISHPFGVKVNLLQSNNNNQTDDDDDDFAETFQGPIIHENEYSRPLLGLEALIHVIRNTNLMSHIGLMLTSYHVHASVRSPGNLQRAVIGCGGGGDHLDGGPAGSSRTDDISTIASNGRTSASSIHPLQTTQQDEIKASFFHERKSSSKRGNYSAVDDDVMMDSWRSLTTPSFIASICNFLRNCVVRTSNNTIIGLVQVDLLYYFTDLMSDTRIEILLQKLAWNEANDECDVPCIELVKRNRRFLLLHDLLKQNVAILQLVTVCVNSEPKLSIPMLNCKDHYIDRIVSIFRLNASAVGSTRKFRSMLRHASELSFDILSSLLRFCMDNKNDLTTFYRNWNDIFGGIKSALQDQEDHVKLLSCINFLSFFFKIEYQRCQDQSSEGLSWLFQNCQDEATAHGQIKYITLSLIKIFETLIVNPSSCIVGDVNSRVMVCSQALQNLFCCSPQAKHTAIQVGFLESILDIMERVNAKLILHFTTSIASSASGNKTSSSTSSSFNFNQVLTNSDTAVSTQPLIALTSLCINLLFNDEQVKQQACDAGLGMIIYKLWKTSLLSPNLRLSLMKLILNYTADCEKAATSLSVIYQSGSQHPCLMSNLVQAAKDAHSTVLLRDKNKHVLPLLHIIFNILNNTSVSLECRAVIWKANLLELFPSAADRGQHPKRTKYHLSLLTHWLKLLLALSFHAGGQLNILKIRDIFVILLELHASNITDSSYHVIRIVRNLCFHSASKSRISSSKPIVSLLISSLEKKTKEIRAIAASALLSLLFNNQKVKVHLKGAGLVKSLQSSIARLTLKEDEGRFGEEDFTFRETLEQLIESVQ